MTAALSSQALRHWLVDYLVTQIGCEADDLTPDSSFADLGLGSRESVVLSGELGELLGRTVSPIEFWQHPTINALVEYLTTSPAQMEVGAVESSGRDRSDEPIAVIGMGCRFPGDMHGPESMWQFLSEGRSAVGAVPPDRWAPFDDGSAEAAAALCGTTRWGSFLTEIDAFDAEFFEISPREAAGMDPQQRLLLEVAYEALEHAGIRADSLRRTQTGVFAGACASEYGYLASSDLSRVDGWSGTGGALSIIANRVSYFFDLRGPSVTVDTACSSSLVAVHLACQSLRAGDSELAIAAGVNLLLSPAITRSFDWAQLMSPTGQCHAFDADADGLVRGEGCGVVVLKRLSDALRDGDRVHAVVRGSAVNQDGRSNGLMAPNPAAQMAVLRAACANAGVAPHEIDYVEAHGSGTLLADPIEARALGTVLGRGRPESGPLLVGTVKSNMGSLEGAGGIAGFMKTVLSLQRGRIPANLHFAKPNPHIPFKDLRLKVVAEPTTWPPTQRPRRAGVSSFGFGGTNAHVVLEQAPDPAPAVTRSQPVVTTLVVSAKTPARIASVAGVLAQWMEGAGADVALADVAHTLNHHRARYPKFATVAALDRAQAIAGLRALAEGRPAPGVVPPHEGPCRSGTVFVFSGQTSHWTGTGRQLLNDEPAFAAAVAELEPTFVEQTGFSLQQVLTDGEALVDSARIGPVLVATQLALTALWRAYDVRPDAVIGDSVGQVSAAVVAGALTAAEGLRVITTWSRLMARQSGPGADSRRPGFDHSELRIELAGLAPQPPVIPIISTDGTAPSLDAAYWALHLGNPGGLTRAVESAGADHATFIEVSPHPLLAEEISRTLAGVHHHSIGTLFRDTHDTHTFHANLNAVHTTHPPDTDHPGEPHPAIPTTPWHHTHHWMSPPAVPRHNGSQVNGRAGDESSAAGEVAVRPAQHWITIQQRMDAAVAAPGYGTLLGQHVAIATTPPVHLWQAWLEPDAKPYPGVHRVRGAEEVPISVLLQTLLGAAVECGASMLTEVRFDSAIVIDRPQLVQVVADDESVIVASAFEPGAPADRWTRHASARISHRQPDQRNNGSTNATVLLHESAAPEQQLPSTEVRPFEWSIGSCQSAPGRLQAEVDVPRASTVALLDAAVHIARLVDRASPRLMFPVAAESVRFDPEFAGSRGVVHVIRRDAGADELLVDLVVTASDGSTCIELRSLRYTAHESGGALVGPAASARPAWSEMSAQDIRIELQARVRAILASELRLPESEVDVDRPFPEFGFDSMMAMAVLREAKRLLGFDLSATMFFDNPTVASLAAHLTEVIAAQTVPEVSADESPVDVEDDSAPSLLDALFDSVESATADSEIGAR